MKIAIFNSQSGFHPRWEAYCKEKGIPYKMVDCYANNLIEQLKDCDILLWHHSQNDPRALVAAKPILFALEQAGKRVFPDFNTNWHFDDKLGQKYLLEAIEAPLVHTYTFFEKAKALQWAENTDLPVVFKLRGGAGSSNVKLIKSRRALRRIIRQSFGRGFPNYNGWEGFLDVYSKWAKGSVKPLQLFKSFARVFVPPRFSSVAGREMEYAMFQRFIPDNVFDIRVVVIAQKAFALKRLVRENDFRASGSGLIQYEKHHFDEETIKIALEVAIKLQSQCVAFDFLYENGKPLMVEISYGFAVAAYDACVGYWDDQFNWHEGPFNPYGWMIESILEN